MGKPGLDTKKREIVAAANTSPENGVRLALYLGLLHLLLQPFSKGIANLISVTHAMVKVFADVVKVFLDEGTPCLGNHCQLSLAALITLPNSSVLIF